MCEDSSFLEQTKSLSTKKALQKKEELLEFFCFKLGFDKFVVVNQNITSVIKFTLVPVSTVVQVGLTSCDASSNLRDDCFEVSSPFIPSCFRYFSFWMRHFCRF